MPSRPARDHLAAVAVMLGGWLWFFPPSGWGKLRDSVTPDLGDPLFNLSIMRWGAARLPDLEAFWNAPFFYPSANAVLRSDHLLGPAVWMKLTEPIAGPVLAYNLLFLLSFVLSGFATYWVLSHRFSWTAALLAGFWWAYAPYRMAELSHLQVLLAQWVPLLLWHFDRLLIEPTIRRAAIFLGFYLLHITGGAYLALMIHAVFAVVAVNRWREIRAGLTTRTALVVWGVVAALVATTLLWVYLPYLQSGVTIDRQLEDLRKGGAASIDFLTPHPCYRWSDLWPAAWPKRLGHMLFPGFLALVLGALGNRELLTCTSATGRPAWLRRLGLGAAALSALLALATVDAHSLSETPVPREELQLAYRTSFLLLAFSATLIAAFWRGRRWPLRMRSPDPWVRGWIWMGLVAALLSVPSVYAHVLGAAPGFDALRVISRFHVFVTLLLALLIAAGVESLVRRIGQPRQVLGVGIAAMALALYPRGVEWHFCGRELVDLPDAHKVLARLDDVEALVEFPIPEDSGHEARRMYFQTFHQKPMINGHSASVPEEYQTVKRLCHGPVPQDAQCYDYLRSLGVNYVLVTPDELHRNVRRDLRLAEERLPLEVVYRGPRSALFRLKAASGMS